ncbi:MAG: hypothetical protein ACFFF4_12660 [Candidatus Thorarchaeota archaeon]
MERKRVVAEGHTLLHPFKMRKELLQDLIPSNFVVDEVLESLNAKQKEIARRLRVSMLLGEKSLGMLGQAALFEILRNRGFTFRSYLNRFRTMWERSKTEGYELLFTLGYIYYLRRFFGYVPIDLVLYLLEPVTRYQLSISSEEFWSNRIITNNLGVRPCVLSNRKINQILTKLVQDQDIHDLTTSRVIDWIGGTKVSTAHLIDILRASRLEHQYRVVSKNTGIVYEFEKSKTKWKTKPSFFSSCTSLDDNETYYVTLRSVFKDDAVRQSFELEAINTNISLYDPKDLCWRLNSSPRQIRTLKDIISLFHNSDLTVPDTNMKLTKRDLFYIALLTTLNPYQQSLKFKEIVDRLVGSFDLPHDEVVRGIQSVFRKNMVRNQYTHPAIMEDCESYALYFDDKKRKIIRFLGEVLQNLPFFTLQISSDMRCGFLVDNHPSYLTCEIRNLIDSSMKEHDVNGEIFAMHSWGFGHPGSILQLVSSQTKH